MKYSLLFLASLSLSTAHATLDLSYALAPGTDDYRLGSEWGKKPVTKEVLSQSTPEFVRAATATAFIPTGGTGFYLGKFDGVHVLATNHHVCPTEGDCLDFNAQFKVLGKSYNMSKFLITLPEIDLSLLAIDVPEEDEALLKSIAKNFSFNKDIVKGQELMTIGFGTGGNPRLAMVANQDSDCRVFSETADYKLMADPDDFNPAPYKAWSFANGCDVSHGDSGSAMVDRNSGEVVGIIWTGKIPKSEVAQNSSNLDEMFKSSSPLIWKELSYAVPAKKIGEILKDLSEDSHTEEETQNVFKAMLR